MTPEEIKVRAANAAQLLENKLLVESLEAIESEILRQWEDCPARDTEGREELWKYYKIAKKFRGVLQGVVENGKVILERERKSTPFDKFVHPLTRTLRR